MVVELKQGGIGPLLHMFNTVISSLANPAAGRRRAVPLQQQGSIGQHQGLPARLQHGGGGRIDNQGWPREPLLGLQLGALPQRHRPPASLLAQPQGSGWCKRGCSLHLSSSHCLSSNYCLFWNHCLFRNHRRGSQLHQQALHDPVFAHRAITEALQMGGAKSSLQVLNPLLVGQPRHLQTTLTAGGPQLQLHPNPASCPLGQIPQPAQVGESLLLQLGTALTQQG